MDGIKAINILTELTTPKEILDRDQDGNPIMEHGYSLEEYQKAVKILSDIVNINAEMEDMVKALKAELCCCKEENKKRMGLPLKNKEINTVTVRWWDGYMEMFKATEVRFGSDLLWMRLKDGNNRHIPLRQVRWFGTTIESHQNTGM